LIGSSIKTAYEVRDGTPALVRVPEVNFNDDKDGKPVAINQHIGRFDEGLDRARAEGWTVVDMKNDWNRIFPFGNR